MQTPLYQELEKYQKEGVELWLNGRPSNSLTIASCVREESDYMRDYQISEDEKIQGIGFDRINPKKKRQ